MARKGRELEQLVALIEEVLVPQGAVVKSPDFIVDRVTGNRREVDVSIRMTVGSSEVLIVLECRDRDVEDVTWIEQLAQKCADLRARVIAVSSAGFSAGAEKKAAHLGIETRRVDELSPAALAGWFQAQEMTVHTQRVEIVYAGFDLDPEWRGTDLGDELKERLSKLGSAGKALVRKTDGLECGLEAVWVDIRNRPDLYAGVAEDGTVMERPIELNFRNPAQRYQVRVGSVLVDIVAMRLVVKLWIERTAVPIDKVYAYRGPEESFAEAVQYRVDVDGQPRLVSFVNDHRSLAVSVTLLDKGENEKKNAGE